MEYAILDEIIETNETNKEIYEQKKGVFIKSGIEKLEEPWGNSDDFKVYIFHNFVRPIVGPIDLLIVIREIPSENNQNGFRMTKVEQAVYPLYCISSPEAIDIPQEIEAPDIHPDIAKFICEKRALPKKPYDKDIQFDPEKYKWDINRLATTLNMSNRIVARYCRAKHI